jgi:hypothetical protein
MIKRLLPEVIPDLLHDIPVVVPLASIVALAWNIDRHPNAAPVIAAFMLGYIIMTRGRWIARLLVAVALICAFHDYFIGQLG